MDGNVAEIIANFIDVVFQFAFLTIVLGKRKNLPAWVFGILAVILAAGTTCAMMMFQNGGRNIFIYMVVGLIFVFAFTGRGFRQGILYFMMWNILLMACGLIYTAAYSFIKQKAGVNVWTMTTSEHIHYLMGSKLMLFLLMVIAIVLLKRVYLKSAMPIMNLVVFVISILIGIILDIMLNYEYLDKRGKLAIEIAMAGIVIINIIVYVTTYKLNKSQKLQMENQMLRMAQEGQKESMERMMQMQEKNRILRHDLRHYFTVFQELLANGSVDEAKNYVREVLDTRLQP